MSTILPRVDKVTLSKEGVMSVVKGVSSVNPKEPAGIDESMHIATITLPAYLYDVKDAEIRAVDNKRYTMRDIGKLEDRIETLEETTSLSLLELDTKTFQVRDVDNLDRFKSGFFVDDFRDSHYVKIHYQEVFQWLMLENLLQQLIFTP